MKLNVPNKLTLLRIVLVPLCVIFLLYPVFGEANAAWTRAVAAAVFIFTMLTDTLDGIIARKYKLITDFGKFLDPLADKFMVFSAFVAMCASDQYAYIRPVLIWATVIVIFRELAITSMRLVVSSSDNVVVAASWLGKVKTTMQCVCILVLILEPVIFGNELAQYHILSWLSIAAMLGVTILSGIDYVKSYAKYLDPTK